MDDNYVLSINEDNQQITLVNRNEIAKTFISLKTGEIEELKKLINGYIRNRNIPKGVVGDDEIASAAYGSEEFRHSTQERFYTF
jgi:hypothetical protein